VPKKLIAMVKMPKPWSEMTRDEQVEFSIRFWERLVEGMREEAQTTPPPDDVESGASTR
jgi:hypothetical protein